MDLMRDLLDSEVVDRHKRDIGRVDGIVAELRPDGPPIVRWIELGGRTKLRRISRFLARWVRRAPCRIAWKDIRAMGRTIEVDIDAADLSALHWERWLRDRIIARIPGGG